MQKYENLEMDKIRK